MLEMYIKKLQLISELIELKVDVHATDNKGRSSLTYVIHSGCTQTVRLLKKYGFHHTINVQQQRSRKTEENVWRMF